MKIHVQILAMRDIKESQLIQTELSLDSSNVLLSNYFFFSDFYIRRDLWEIFWFSENKLQEMSVTKGLLGLRQDSFAASQLQCMYVGGSKLQLLKDFVWGT